MLDQQQDAKQSQTVQELGAQVADTLNNFLNGEGSFTGPNGETNLNSCLVEVYARLAVLNERTGQAENWYNQSNIAQNTQSQHNIEFENKVM